MKVKHKMSLITCTILILDS